MTYDPDTDDMMNPGIKETVRLLRELGFQTVDSGDGATHHCECDVPVPFVHMTVEPDALRTEADRLKEIVESRAGLTIWDRELPDPDPDAELGDTYTPSIQASYSPLDGMGIISMYGVADTDLFAPRGGHGTVRGALN